MAMATNHGSLQWTRSWHILHLTNTIDHSRPFLQTFCTSAHGFMGQVRVVATGALRATYSTQRTQHGTHFCIQFFFYFMTDDLFGEGTFLFLLLFLFTFLCVSQDNR